MLTRCVVDCTVITEVAGYSETLVFMYETIHVTYTKNVVLTLAVSSSTDFPGSVQVTIFDNQVMCGGRSSHSVMRHHGVVLRHKSKLISTLAPDSAAIFVNKIRGKNF